jgi:hypothetical protein
MNGRSGRLEAIRSGGMQKAEVADKDKTEHRFLFVTNMQNDDYDKFVALSLSLYLSLSTVSVEHDFGGRK